MTPAKGKQMATVISSVSQQEAASRLQHKRKQAGPGLLAEMEEQTMVTEQTLLGSWNCDSDPEGKAVKSQVLVFQLWDCGQWS